jgi:protein-arginine kinase activator protein McsA
MKTCAECGRSASFSCSRAGVETWLCAHCTESRAGISGLTSLIQAFNRPRQKSGQCPYCGTTETTLEETGLVGCPLCYEALRDQISKMV